MKKVIKFLCALVLTYLAFQSFPLLIINNAYVFPRLALMMIATGIVAGLFELDCFWANGLVAFCSTSIGFFILTLLKSTASFGSEQISFLGAISVIAGASAIAAGMAWIVGKGYRHAVYVGAVLAVSLVFVIQIQPIISAVGNPSTDAYQATHVDFAQTGFGYDGFLYAQVLNNLKNGESYYQAVGDAHKSDKRNTTGAPLASVFNFREPLLAWALSHSPGEGLSGVIMLYCLFAFGVAWAAYFFVKRFAEPGVALVAFLLVSNYFIAVAAQPLLRFDYLFAEIWAAGLVIIALWALVTQRVWLSALFLVLAVANREYALMFIPIWVLFWAFSSKRDRKEWLPYAFTVIGSILALSLHMHAASAYIARTVTGVVGSGAGEFSIRTWLQGSMKNYRAAMQYKLVDSTIIGYFSAVLPLLALAGVCAVRENRYRIPLVVTTLGMGVFFRFISAGYWSMYWGALGIPIFFMLMTLIGAFAFPSYRNMPLNRRKVGRIKVVLPAYNEEKSIVDLLQQLAVVLDATKLPWMINVRDDCSTDATAALSKGVLPASRVMVSTNKQNLGLGGNIDKGLYAATRKTKKNDVIITMDADLTQSPEYIPALLEQYEQGYDVVIASRYRPGSKVHGLSLFRHTMTLGARGMLSLAFPVLGVRDYSCGYRLYSASLLKSEYDAHGADLICQRGFACMVELLCKIRKDARVIEIPFTLHYEEKRQASSMNVGKTVLSYVENLVNIFVYDFRKKAPVDE